MKILPALLKSIAGRRILVIGDVILDRYLWGDATRISPEAPVPVVHVLKETDTVGGAANVANNIAALGAAAEVVGAVGRDANGTLLLKRLKKLGIGFDPHFRMAGVGTITKTRVLVRNQQLCRLDHEGPPSHYRRVFNTPATLKRLAPKIAAADGIILSDYAKGILNTELVSQLTALARAQGKFIALDPKPANGIQFTDLDLLTPNRKEAIELSGIPPESDDAQDFEKICARIWKQYQPRNLVITLGADGMLISNGGRIMRQIDTAARQVYDVSGAGDTVIAALALALTSGASLEDAAHFANAAAGVVVGKLGTATVTPQELSAYLDG